MKRSLFLVCTLLLFLLSACGEAPGEDVAATFRGEPISRELVALYQEYSDGSPSDRDIVNLIVSQQILKEEAEARGMTATEEEVQQFLQDTAYASYEMPEGKAIIDEYCQSQGITFDQYIERLRQQAPATIVKAKLEEAVAREYCERNNIPFDALNPTNDVRQAIADYETGLWDENKKEIKYYVD